MGIFSSLFGYKWSMYFRNDGAIEYAMHENSVIRILGYVLTPFIEHKAPKPPWDVVVNFNVTHHWLKLHEDHFMLTQEGPYKGEPTLSPLLLSELASIDSNFRTRRGGEPIFEEGRTKKKIPVYGSRYSSVDNFAQNAGRDAISDAFSGREREVNYYQICNSIFDPKLKAPR